MVKEQVAMAEATQQVQLLKRELSEGCKIIQLVFLGDFTSLWKNLRGASTSTVSLEIWCLETKLCSPFALLTLVVRTLWDDERAKCWIFFLNSLYTSFCWYIKLKQHHWESYKLYIYTANNIESKSPHSLWSLPCT